MDEKLTVHQIVNAISETWEQYGAIENPTFTSSEIKRVSNFIDYLRAMVDEGE